MTPAMPHIFLSYSSADRPIADKIDGTFSAVGLHIIRDERDLSYRGSIESFMVEGVRKNDYVLVLLSDDYLKSRYCTFELGELMKTPDFSKKVLPVYLEGASLFSRQGKKVLYDYWDERIKEAEKDSAQYSSSDFNQQLDHFRQSRRILADLFAMLDDLKLQSFGELEASGYRQLFELIGVDGNGLVQRCIRALNIKDEEEQLIALDELQSEYPNNQEIAFAKAVVYAERKRFKAARKFHEDYIKHHTYDVHTMHYNLALILEREFKEYDAARHHYEQAVSIKPDYAWAHNNLGILLIKHFNDPANARDHFEAAIRSNPTMRDAHMNLGRLCANTLHDYPQAATSFMKATHLRPLDYEAHMLLGDLAQTKLHDYDMAINAYSGAIRSNGLSFHAHYRLARLLDEQSRYEDAVAQYRVSIMLDPAFSAAHTNLGILLVRVYDDCDGARKEFEEALKIDPDDDSANFNLAVLMSDFLGDPTAACIHYQRAIQKNPAQKSEQLDALCRSLNKTAGTVQPEGLSDPGKT